MIKQQALALFLFLTGCQRVECSERGKALIVTCVEHGGRFESCEWAAQKLKLCEAVVVR